MKSMESKKTAKAFFKARILRLFPQLWLVILLCTFVMGRKRRKRRTWTRTAAARKKTRLPGKENGRADARDTEREEETILLSAVLSGPFLERGQRAEDGKGP